VSPARYELGFNIPEDGTLDWQRRENLKPYNEQGTPFLPRVQKHQVTAMMDVRGERVMFYVFCFSILSFHLK
jgi:hypothetical protein